MFFKIWKEHVIIVVWISTFILVSRVGIEFESNTDGVSLWITSVIRGGLMAVFGWYLVVTVWSLDKSWTPFISGIMMMGYLALGFAYIFYLEDVRYCEMLGLAVVVMPAGIAFLSRGGTKEGKGHLTCHPMKAGVVAIPLVGLLMGLLIWIFDRNPDRYKPKKRT